MTDARSIILHHYQTSPFSEKIRLALRLKNLAWTSVDIPVIMPKPDLIPLTGGYRRTPVMQIGADIYCDTSIILREIEKRFHEPPLTSPGHEGLHSMVGIWADRQWFQASVAVIFGTIGDHVTEEFKQDREELSGRPFNTDAMKAAAPMMKDQWRAMLMWVEERLEAGRGAGTGAWMFGSKPGLIDVHAYMNIWFVKNTVPAFVDSCLKDAPRTLDWYNRLNEYEGQEPETLSSAEAVEIAFAAAPRLVATWAGEEPQGFAPGDHVAVAPDDYGQDWVTGELVCASPQRITIQRKDDRAGTVHVHFPRAGFLVRRAD